MTASVLWTGPVSTLTAGPRVRTRVVRMPSARPGITAPSARVPLATWVTP